MSTIDSYRTYFRNKIKNENTIVTGEEKHLFFIFVLIVIFKYAYLGYAYIPFLDDYVQYGLYPNMDNSISSVLFGGAKTIYTRPFAALTDIYIIGKAGLNNLGAVLFVITLLYAVSAILFFSAFKKIKSEPSAIFLVLYALLPCATEGTLWISSSSRIVPPLFFLSLSLYLAVKFNGKYDIYGFVFIWLLNLLSYGYYEQISVVSFILTIYFSYVLKDRKLFFTAAVNFILLTAYYLTFARLGNNGDRFFFGGINNVLSKVGEVSFEILNMWLNHGLWLNIKGFKRGLEILITDSSFLWLLVMSALVLTLFSSLNKINSQKSEFGLGKKSKGTSYKNKKNGAITHKIRLFKENILNNPEYNKMTLGAVLFIASYFPFYITGNTWLNFRNAAAAIPGFALMLDGIINKFIKNREAVNFISSVLIVFFLIATVSEIRDYTDVAKSDMEIVQNAAEFVDEDTKDITVMIRYKNYKEQNAHLRDHIMSLTDSEYGICGAVRALSGNYSVNVKMIVDNN